MQDLENNKIRFPCRLFQVAPKDPKLEALKMQANIKPEASNAKTAPNI